MQDPNDYLNTLEAARYLRLSPNTLSGWRSHDRGPAFCKLGTAVRYKRAALDAWAERGKVVTNAA